MPGGCWQVHRRVPPLRLMIYYELIALVLQPDDLAHRRRDFYHSGQIMLPHLVHYFFNAFLVAEFTGREKYKTPPRAHGCLRRAGKREWSA